jgi:hypothetical protein
MLEKAKEEENKKSERICGCDAKCLIFWKALNYLNNFLTS